MMKLIPLPAFADNSARILHGGAMALVVNPGDAAVVQAALDARGLELATILVTHRHADPGGGAQAPGVRPVTHSSA